MPVDADRQKLTVRTMRLLSSIQPCIEVRFDLAKVGVFACLVAGLLGVSGCQSVRVRDDPYFNKEAYARHPPVTVALAPMKNGTPYEEAHVMMRRALYGALAPLGYKDVELDEVDRFVAMQAMKRNCAPEELDRWYIAQPELADTVIFGEIKNVSRTFLLVYSSIRVDLSLDMVDTRSKTVTYSNEFHVVNGQFNLPSSWFGIGSSLFTSLWHMRGDQIETSVNEASTLVTARLDRTIGTAVAEMASVAKVKVTVRDKHLRAGDEIQIGVEAPAGCRLHCSIGEVARALPMQEVRPGYYEGRYRVKPGDNAKFTFASVTLHDAPNEASGFVFSAADQAFELDTMPPGVHIVDKWGTYPGRRGLALHITALDPLEAPAARLHVYRREADGKEAPEWLGVAEGREFRDQSALAGRRYEYMIIAEDAAGNRSVPESRFVTVPGDFAQTSSAP